MVRFRVGSTHEDGGRYLQRLDGDGGAIYLTSEGVSLATGTEAYLDREVLNVPQAEIRAVRGSDFELERDDDGQLALASAPAGAELEQAALNKAGSGLSYLEFDRVHVADAAEVRGLAFDRTVEYRLDDDSGYVLSLAERDGRHFLRLSGFASVDRVEFTEDSSEDELREKADQLTRADEIQEFNQFHGSWIYEVPERVAEKLRLARADLVG